MLPTERKILRPLRWGGWEAVRAARLGPTPFLRSAEVPLLVKRPEHDGTMMANEAEPAPEGGGAVVSLSTAASAAPAAKPAPKKYTATIYASEAVTPEFADAIAELEKLLRRKIWMMIQNGRAPWGEVSRSVFNGFREHKGEIVKDESVALLIQSPGGLATEAYKIVRLFQRRTESFSTIVPLYAKSAATLMACAGREIVMGMDAELGPLDVQLYDEDKEYYDSALNAVQSLERLNAYALSSFDQAMLLFMARMNKKADALMPTALSYATNIVRPLVEKIDTIELTRKSRELKVAEDYAVRLMRPNYPDRECKRIASSLVERYSTHEFFIDQTEASAEGATPKMPLNLGLNIAFPSREVEDIFTKLVPYLERATFIGRVTEL